MENVKIGVKKECARCRADGLKKWGDSDILFS